ncbi:Copper chaperone [Mycobacterium marinum MB2]|uniref:Heavy-metal-associated domain protein n=1 Tax=Mycobacterium ulcerans str. Harvey TaxID=1299332 RepID=A0ABN0QTM2_MYCUL|nr:Copper chaperone [Mycobacterium marinum MB2]EUA88086.1 heavy-metal-associated domain protein [Mycobacterium ulcerans str. Harvey]
MMNTSEYQVAGMRCGHCESAIRSEVAQIPGVATVAVSARTGRLLVAGSAPIDPTTVLGAIDEAGYQAVLVA